MKLVDTKNIIVTSNFNTKEEIIKNMIDKLNETIDIKEKIYEEVMEREKIKNTVIGFGFAVPHTKSEYVKEAKVIYSHLNNIIEWDEEEEEGVNNVVLIVIPKDNASLHIDILKDLSLKVIDENFRDALNNAKTIDEIEKILNK